MTDDHTPPALPPSLEQVLAEAASDATLRDRLLTDRRAALAGRGLSESELAIIAAVPDDQLRQMLEQLAGQALVTTHAPLPADVRCQGIRPDDEHHDPQLRERVRGTRPGRLLLAAAVTSAAIGGGATLLCSMGVRPDRPEQITQPHEARGDAGTSEGGPDGPGLDEAGGED